jgi:tRNA A-37 threonylcarbamoyl transferase component Bud32
MDELVGKAFGPYTIVERIGEGGMAVVYKGYQESLNRYVAIKVLRGELAHDQQFITRFRREALAAAKLNHPNLLHVYDAGVAHGVYYIVMDYAPGGTLKELMMRGPMDPERAASIVAQVADALDYAHRQGLVHRDVKPTNILFTLDGRPQLTDFGIAKALYETTQLTRTGTSIGTPDYMAPEQIQGQPVDGRTDLYSLGIVLYEMLSGQVPFRGSTPVAVLYKQVNEAPPPLRSLNILIPGWLEAVLDKAVAKRPQDRFQSGSELAQALRQQYIPGAAVDSFAARRATPPPAERRAAPSPARPAPPVPGSRPGGRSRGLGPVPILLGAIAVVLVAMVGVGAVLLLGDLGPKQVDEGSPAVVTMVVTSQVVTQVVTVAPSGLKATSIPVWTDTPLPRPATATTVPPTSTPRPVPTQTPVWDIPSLQANVSELRFFEGPYTMPPHDERQYTTRFASSSTRYINYELNLEFPEPGRYIEFQVEAVYYQPDGSELTSFTADYHLEADWTTSWHAKGWGWDDPGQWSVGTYYVELYVDGQLIATGAFEVY